MTPTLPLWFPLVLIFFIAISIWLGISLVIGNKGNTKGNRLLGIFLLIQVMPLANVYSKIQYGTNEWCWLIATNLAWLYGPFIFFFTLTITQTKYSTKQLVLHSIPFFLSLAFRYSPFAPEHIPLYLTIPLIAHAIVYIGISCLHFGKNKAVVANVFHSDNKPHLVWLIYLIIGIALIFIVDAFFMLKANFHSAMNYSDWFVFIMVISMFLHGIVFCSLFKPNVFYQEYKQLIHKVPFAKKVMKTLDQGLANQLSLELEQKMLTEKWYLEEDLTMPSLANKMGISAHQLSELLNSQLEKNFYEYINHFRLQQAKRMLSEDSFLHLTVSDIAYQSGFNNKNSFYRFFKQDTGMTPTNYRKINKSE